MTVKEILRQNNYRVTLTKADDTTFCLLTPSRSLTIYNVHWGAQSGFSATESGAPQFLPLPEFAIRLILACDIQRKCRDIKYNPAYMFLFDKEQEVQPSSLVKFLPGPELPHNQEKEAHLIRIFQQAIKTNFSSYYLSEANDRGVLLPYLLSEAYFKGQ